MADTTDHQFYEENDEEDKWNNNPHGDGWESNDSSMNENDLETENELKAESIPVSSTPMGLPQSITPMQNNTGARDENAVSSAVMDRIGNSTDNDDEKILCDEVQQPEEEKTLLDVIDEKRNTNYETIDYKSGMLFILLGCS